MLVLISTLVAAAALFGWVSARWLKLPNTVGTMLLTAATSTALLLMGRVFPGPERWALETLRQVDFERLILHGMLSLLLFAGAFLVDIRWLSREKLIIGLLAVPGTVLSTSLVGLLTFWAASLVGLQPTMLECFIFGALISPTDPIAVLEMLRRVRTPKHVEAQLAGESLFNDGVGAVLFVALLSAARGQAVSVPHIGGMLLVEAGGGIVLGVGLAAVISLLMRTVWEYPIDILLTLALALGGYAIADRLGLSAPLEAVAAGIALRWFNTFRPAAAIEHPKIDGFWTALDEVQNAVLFVLLGYELIVVKFTHGSVMLGLAEVVIVNGARALCVGAALLALRLLQPKHESSWTILSWGGLRGGLSIALALSVPAAMGAQWMLTATYIVVLFSIIVQGVSLDLFLRRRGEPLRSGELVSGEVMERDVVG